ncbi:unnamed protein product, partial [Timema podura]|nr:unnamed protein product [Timema podura]
PLALSSASLKPILWEVERRGVVHNRPTYPSAPTRTDGSRKHPCTPPSPFSPGLLLRPSLGEAGRFDVSRLKRPVLFQGLFRNAISQSGTALTPWGLLDGQEARTRAFKLGKLLGCRKNDLKDSQALMRCLRMKEAGDISMQAVDTVVLITFVERDRRRSHDLTYEYMVEALVLCLKKTSPLFQDRVSEISYPFVPVVEPEGVSSPFLPDHPLRLMEENDAGVPWLAGVVRHEGLPQALQAMVFPALMDGLNDETDKFLLQYIGLSIQPKERARSIARKIWNYYFHNDTLEYANLARLADVSATKLTLLFY